MSVIASRLKQLSGTAAKPHRITWILPKDDTILGVVERDQTSFYPAWFLVHSPSSLQKRY